MAVPRILEFAVAIAGLSFLCGAAQAQNAMLSSTASTQGSGTSSGTTQPAGTFSKTPAPMLPTGSRPPARQTTQTRSIPISELLSGVTLTDEQRSKIEQTSKDMRSRMNLVVNDPKENADQKQAMLDGLQRMEVQQVYLLLTPDQRAQVRQKLVALRGGDQQPTQNVPPKPLPNRQQTQGK